MFFASTMNVQQKQYSNQSWKVLEEEETLRKTWMSTVEEKTTFSLHRATKLAQDSEKWRKLAHAVRAHVRQTRLKKK